MVDSLFFITNTLSHMSSIKKEADADLELEKIYRTAVKDKSLSIIINGKKTKILVRFIGKNTK